MNDTPHELHVLVRDYGDVFACGAELYRGGSLTVIGSLFMPKADTPSSKNEAVRQTVSVMLNALEVGAEVIVKTYNWHYTNKISRLRRVQLIGLSKCVNILGCTRPTEFRERVEGLEMLADDAARRALTVISRL